MARGASRSVTRALARSLLVGLALLWLVGVLGSGYVLKRLVDEKSDDELRESAAILMSVVGNTDDLLMAAAVLGEQAQLRGAAPGETRFVYQIRDASGRVLLHSANADQALRDLPLVQGLADAGPWRVATLADATRTRWVQFGDPLADRHDALVTALLWLTLPLGALLALAAALVFRASRTLVRQVEATAVAMARQDPAALGMLPLDGVVTEMRPAIEATNQLLRRLATAFEAERSFTYNSAHELRTPIAAAMAQAQLVETAARGTPVEPQARALVGSLGRLARLAERLLALARAEGAQALSAEPVDLATVVKLTVDEFRFDPRLDDREIVAHAAPARVTADLDGVGLALRNLVENALAHGRPGTRIVVACRTVGGHAELSVTDDGPGYAGDPRALVKRFVRGDEGHGAGAGLGLSIVEMLARRMGARLLLASPPEGRLRGFEARIAWSLAPAAEEGKSAPRR